MARKSKWVGVSSPSEPVVDVARRALEDRLKLAWRYLRRASQGAPSDTENIHQLRVSTRRAMAALEIFGDLLPRRRGRWMAKQLKRVRQAAGAARDLDVMLARFQPLAEEELPDGGFEALVHLLKVRRQRAQDPVDVAFEKLDRRKLAARINGLVRRVRLRSKEDKLDRPSFAEAAHAALAPQVSEFFQAGEADFSDDARLHAFRIQGKRLRYTMEIFAEAFVPSFREDLYPLVAALQELLGQVNDHATARAQFQSWQEEDLDPVVRSKLESLVAEETEALEVSRRQFMEWWTPERREELRQRFREALDGLESSQSGDQSSDEERPSETDEENRGLALRRAE